MNDGDLRPADLNAPGTSPPPSPRRPKTPWIVAGLVLLLGLAAIGFLSRRAIAPPTPRPHLTPLAPVDPAARAAAETARDAWIALQRELRPGRADLWAGEEHTRLESLVGQAERDMAARRFSEAGSGYRQAARLAERLINRGPRDAPGPLMASAMNLYADGDGDGAVERLRAILFLVPGQSEAMDLLPRDQRAEQTHADLVRAREALAQGVPEVAHLHIERAHAADPRFPGVSETRETIRGRLAAEEAAARFSLAENALDAGELDLAAEHLAQGLLLRPEDSRGLGLQARLQTKTIRLQTRRLQSEAEAAERGENWEQAHRAWLEIQSLAPDTPGVDEALARTREFQLLRERVNRAMGSLNSTLAADTVADLQTLDLESFPPGLARGVRNLIDTWTLHHTPVDVRFTSDGETSVTILRVARLGTFVETSRTLKPGSYTAVGERLGHRDVRVHFTVPAGGEPPAVDVRASEGIGTGR